ncbi:MAG: hypothetical protein ACLU3U_07445 [Gallintestinimicrobium sp.]
MASFVELKRSRCSRMRRVSRNIRSALELRQRLRTGIDICRMPAKAAKEKANDEAQHRKGSQVYPDFRLIMMARLEA